MGIILATLKVSLLWLFTLSIFENLTAISSAFCFKVIATSFIERDVRESTSWYEHAQNLGTSSAVLDMIKYIVKKDRDKEIIVYNEAKAYFEKFK